MRFDIVTIFAEFFGSPSRPDAHGQGILGHGILERALRNGLAEVHTHDLRNFTHDRHRTVDDRPFGGTTPPGVFYRYTPDRKGEHPREHLRDFRGILQADGYAGFARIYGNRVAEAACMAHVRRKFFDVFETSKSPLARTAMDKIAALYGIEAEIRGRPSDERLPSGKMRMGMPDLSVATPRISPATCERSED